MEQRLGNYVVVDTLGRGGMGAVFRARHTELDVERAIKVMSRLDNPRTLARFEREAQVLGEVRHANVVKVHEAGVERGQPYFVMDLVEGQPLSERMQSGPSPWREALEIAIGIARGAGALHAAGIVHRDLKPANVVLAADGRPVVIDLGLAVAPERDDRLTKTGAMVGTLNYMAPEQLGGAEPDPRADVYAIGLMTYELITGEPAIDDDGGGVHVLTAAILSKQRPSPSSSSSELPAAVDHVCLRAMAREPEARQADANVLADELEAILQGPGRTAGQARRRRQALIATAIALPLLGLALALTLQRPPPPSADGSPEDPSANPTGSASATDPPAPRELAAAEIAAGTDELREVRREKDPRKRLARADDWLQRYSGHPRVAKARVVRDQARLEFPLFVVEKVRTRDACFTSAGLAISDGSPALRLYEGPNLVHTWLLDFSPSAVDVAPDGVTVVCGGTRGQIVLINVNHRAGPIKIGTVAEFRFRSLDFDPTGALVLAGGSSPHALTLDVPSFLVQGSYLRHSAPIHGVTFAANGTRVVTVCGRSAKAEGTDDHAVRVFDLQGKVVGMVRQGVMVESVDAHGDLIAAGNSAGQLALIREDGKEVVYLAGDDVRRGFTTASTAIAHQGAIRGLAFSPSGKQLYTVGNDMGAPTGEFRVWDVRSGQQLLPTTNRAMPPVVRESGALNGIRVSPDGRRAMVWTDAALEVWQLPASD